MNFHVTPYYFIYYSFPCGRKNLLSFEIVHNKAFVCEPKNILTCDVFIITDLKQVAILGILSRVALPNLIRVKSNEA
jgi:hypothetical protein